MSVVPCQNGFDHLPQPFVMRGGCGKKYLKGAVVLHPTKNIGGMLGAQDFAGMVILARNCKDVPGIIKSNNPADFPYGLLGSIDRKMPGPIFDIVENPFNEPGAAHCACLKQVKAMLDHLQLGIALFQDRRHLAGCPLGSVAAAQIAHAAVEIFFANATGLDDDIWEEGIDGIDHDLDINWRISLSHNIRAGLAKHKLSDLSEITNPGFNPYLLSLTGTLLLPIE